MTMTPNTAASAKPASAAMPPPLGAGAASAQRSAADAITMKKDRLAKLKTRVTKPGEASFFFYEAHFQSDAVKILPGEYFVFNEDLLIMTTLGSCIAVCLWDRQAHVGGMNHFMLPDNGGSGADSGRYGGFAMELLINELLKMGANRMTLEAKVFGGGAVLQGMNSINVGERNTQFVMDYLKTERIPIVSKDVLDIYPRKVCFFPHSGKAMVKRLAPSNPETIVAQERAALQKPVAANTSSGSIELF
jgi:chemotaxis protein CheD